MKNLKRILDLISKTGDRYIFENEQGEIFVISSLSDYERLIIKDNQEQVKKLSEEELLEKINQDIAVWKTAQQDELSSNILDFDEDQEIDDVDNNANNEEDRYYFEPVDEE